VSDKVHIKRSKGFGGFFLDVILSRRSIRRYQPLEVESEDIDSILAAGDAAPCAMGRRSWHFIVIRERAILDRIPKFHPYSKMVLEAPLAILVCADTTVETREGYWVQNCSAAIENILLEARSKGLGSVWLGVYPREERISGMRQLIDLPEHVVPFAIAVIGHPAEEKEPYTGYEPERVHFDKW
jgi:nitroreductase